VQQDNFWSRHRAAIETGLNDEWALKVAYGFIELDGALGDMDMDAESEYDPNFELPGDDINEDGDDYIPW